MRAGRSLIGIILIALVLSTLITAFIIGERGTPYAIVKHEYRSSGRSRFLSGVVLLAKEPMGSLTISHYCLVNRTDLIHGINRTGSPDEVCGRIPSLRSYLDMASGGFREPETARFEVEVPIWVDLDHLIRKRFDLYLYDFSKTVWQAVPWNLMHSLDRPGFGRGHLWDYYNAFACLFDQNGNLTFFYEGVADFYSNKVISIEELTIQRNDNKSVYYGVTEEGTVKENVLSVLDAPQRGVVRFEDLGRNDQISVLLSIDSSKMPSIDGIWAVSMQRIVHVVGISVDQEIPEFLTGTVDPPKPVPPV